MGNLKCGMVHEQLALKYIKIYNYMTICKTYKPGFLKLWIAIPGDGDVKGEVMI